MLTHALYIDDSGTKEYAAKPEDYDRRRGISRFFVFCGSLMTIDSAGRLSSKLIALKLAHFGDDSVEIKSNWLRIPNERRRHYLEPYGLTDAELGNFVAEFYEAIKDEPGLMFIAAIVDKLHMQEDYGKPWYAPAIAYELLLQRVQQELPVGDTVATIIDDMSGATPKGNQYKENLKAQHKRLRQHGGSLRNIDFSCLASLRFVDSASSQILQVSDVAAYNVHRQFIDHGDNWEQHAEKLEMYSHFGRIAEKFRRGHNGRVQGYGIAKFPLRERVVWVLPK